jgi:tagaturonate reductase
LLQQRAAPWSPVAVGVLADLPETIVQFGEGAFLRGFVDWMVDIANEKGLLGGSIVVVQPIRQGMARLLNQQEGLYTLLLRGVQDGQVVESRRIITAVRRAIQPYEQWPEAAECFRNPGLRIVVSNTTEAGIVYVDEPYRPGICPESFPAKVAALLVERFRAIEGDPAKGLIFLPCELIDRNGDELRRCVLRHAEAWELGPEFRRWIDAHNHFLNTLVDRIVSGYPRDDAARLAGELGYEDELLDAGEIFHLWVIEGPARLACELPFEKAGLNVVWTGDLAPYRTRKVRILNGAHTAGALIAFQAGLNTVQEMMLDPLLGAFLRSAVLEEILPAVPLGEREKREYAQSVFERFCNPFLRHALLSIALNSVSKWKTRVLPSVLDFLKANGRLPPSLTFSLAALVHFYRGQRGDSTELHGRRGDSPYPIRDEPAVLDFFEKSWTAHRAGRSARDLATSVLANRSFWDADLSTVPGLTETVAAGLDAILQHGARDAVKMLVPPPLC